MVQITTITAEDADSFRSRVSQAFGRDADPDEASRARFEAIFDLDRTFAAFDGSDIVGTCAAFSLGLTVPGGTQVPMGGTTVVTVRPTHRRQGVLRALMASHLDEITERGEPLAGLWASEGAIYGRFGYGPATHHHEIGIDARGVSFRDTETSGGARLLEPGEAEPVLRSVYEQARPERAGMLSRSDAWWTHRLMADPESWRRGKSAHRHVVYEEEGDVTGYATYRQKSDWEDSLPEGTVSVTELIHTTAMAHRGLWGFLTGIDLFPHVEYWNMPIDDALPLELDDHRRVVRKLGDALWVRVMDVPAALEARGYEADGVVVFALRDRARPSVAGTYRLEVSEGEAQCERVGTTPSVEFDSDVLGALYLGGGNALALADAGRIAGDRSAMRTLHRIMRTDVAPWCPEVF